MRHLIRRVRQWLRWREFDADLSEEMAFHRALRERELEAGDMDARDAAIAARDTNLLHGVTP